MTNASDSTTTLTPAGAAVILGHKSPSRVLQLIRDEKLPQDLTVKAVHDYRDSRGRKSKGGDGVKTFHVKCTPEQAVRIAEEFEVEVINPYDLTKARDAKALEVARQELIDAGLV